MAMTENLPSIFVSVASFCDPLLVPTVRDGVQKAQHPHRLHWAIVDQHPIDRRDELYAVLGPANLRYLLIDPVQSRGVCWARALVGTLFQDEDYVLQIDSHMLFEPGWDTELVSQMTALRLRSPKPLISIYPYGFEFENDKPVATAVDPAVQLVFRVAPQAALAAHDLTLTFQATAVAASHEALEGFHVAGGFLFAPGSFMLEVPYDPQLYFHG